VGTRSALTASHDTVCRSHAFYHITMRPKGAPASAAGSLMFVDLAGSERAAGMVLAGSVSFWRARLDRA
jgi:hypothetical protein